MLRELLVKFVGNWLSPEAVSFHLLAAFCGRQQPKLPIRTSLDAFTASLPSPPPPPPPCAAAAADVQQYICVAAFAKQAAD
jgi:hypothetical protein